jgi:TPP-dependent pyruvate/acetoin dehydrogenase alpha subunit
MRARLEEDVATQIEAECRARVEEAIEWSRDQPYPQLGERGLAIDNAAVRR